MSYNIVNSSFTLGSNSVNTAAIQASAVTPEKISVNFPMILSTTNSIDGTAIAATTIYTVPMGKSCICTGANVRLTAIAGIGPGVPTVAIYDSTAVANLINGKSLTGLTSTTTANIFPLNDFSNTVSFVAAAGDVIQFNVSIGATFAPYTLSVDLFGYLI